MSPKMENQMEKTWRIEREARVMGGIGTLGCMVSGHGYSRGVVGFRVQGLGFGV